MALSIVTVLFLGLALLVALGILFFVAAPHLRERDSDRSDRSDREGKSTRPRRHTSRTGR